MSVPTRQEILSKDFNYDFIKAMENNVHQSWFRYGFASDNYARDCVPVDPLENVRKRLELFEITKNTNYLVDAANFLMYAFTYLKDTHYDPVKEHKDCYIGAAHKQMKEWTE